MASNDALIEELIDDLSRFAVWMEEFANRWCKYGEQLKDTLTEIQQQRIFNAISDTQRRLEAIPLDEDWIQMQPVVQKSETKEA